MILSPAIHSHLVGKLPAAMQRRIERIFKKLENAAYKASWTPLLVSTVRSPDEQLKRYRIGRTLATSAGMPVTQTYLQISHVVTNEPPWRSPHCFGYAADIALVSNNDSQWLPFEDPLWLRLGELAATEDLSCRGDHLFDPGWEAQPQVAAQQQRLRELWVDRSKLPSED